ncbi:MAG TPA: calcium-binding protein [Caulobacter sp.]|nr:calcium-binding protein [Caulobacter sp.]
MATFNGNNNRNIITGTAAADVINGFGGNDDLYGGGGNDIIDGGTGDDYLFGEGGDDRLIGGNGFNDLWGGAGADTFAVSARNTGFSDDLIWDFTFDVDRIDVSAWGISDISQIRALLFADSTGSAALNAFYNGYDHYLTLDGVDPDELIAADFIFSNAAAKTETGTAYADTLFGSRFNDTLNGGAGDDILLGGLGNDRMTGGGGLDDLVGGAGDDVYIVEVAGDWVFELAGEGVDRIESATSRALDPNVENLTLTGVANVSGTGNELANVMIGNAGANQLNGMAGADRIDGGAGADRIHGGLGADVLTGGAAGDRFVVSALNESALAASDRITDFDPTLDLIDVSAIDANTALSGNQAFTWADAFTGVRGQAVLSYDAATNTTSLLLDQNGDRTADLRLLITGQFDRTDGGFLL